MKHARPSRASKGRKSAAPQARPGSLALVLVWLWLVPAWAFSQPGKALPPEAPLSLVEAVVRLKEGATAGEVWVIVKGPGPAGAAACEVKPRLVLCDWLDEPCGPGESTTDHRSGSESVSVRFPGDKIARLGGSGKVCYWRVSASVEGLTVDTKEDRWLTLEYGEKRAVQKYELTNRPEGELKWSLAATPKEIIHGGGTTAVGLVVTVSGKRSLEPEIAGSSLQDKETRKTIDKSLLTLSSPVPVVEGGSSKTLELKISTPPAHGTYEGEVSMLARGSNQIQKVPLTVHSSSFGATLLGFGLILVGIILSMLLSVFMPYRSKRLSALEAATRLHEHLELAARKLTEASDKTQVIFPNLNHEIDDLKKELEKGKMLPRLPPRIPALGVAADSATTLKAFLESSSQQVRSIQIIVERGVASVFGLWPNHTGPNERAAMKTAFTDLDSLYTNSLTPEQAVAQLKTILGKLDSALTSLAALAGPLGGPQPPPTARELGVQIETLNRWMWSLWLLITLAAGWAVLILPDAGFGTPHDLWRSFLWGLGVFSVGNALETLTPGSIRSAFNIKIPGS